MPACRTGIPAGMLDCEWPGATASGPRDPRFAPTGLARLTLAPHLLLPQPSPADLSQPLLRYQSNLDLGSVLAYSLHTKTLRTRYGQRHRVALRPSQKGKLTSLTDKKVIDGRGEEKDDGVLTALDWGGERD
ncbi:hypothetical protein OPQ81_000083 [Rhizoctonia solani]|nr:hypothetical protein OPQ81_000083 [Rhizoctonia solani]